MNHLSFILKWRSLFGFAFLILFQAACSSQSKSLQTLPKDQIIFGRGGGMSGEVQSHILMDNGQLYATSSLFADTTHLADLAPESTKKLFEQLDSLHLAQLNFQHPGNRYYFIKHQQQKVVWGARDTLPPPIVQRLYDSLQSFVPKQK